MMSELKGIKLKKLDFELQKMGDLYSFEGPFLSHFRDERGLDYLMNWVDVNEVTNRWMLLKVNQESLNKYFSKKMSLLHLIESNESGVVHFLDIDSKADYKGVWVVSTDDIPNDYSPKENSFFDARHANKYALDLAKDNKEFLLSSKDSFMHKAVKQLFGSRAKARNIFYSHSINSPWSYEPNTIDEMTTVRAMYFPLLLHYYKDSHNLELRNLIATHSQAYSNPIVCRAYITNARAIVVGRNPHEFINREFDIDEIWEEIMQSTIQIIQTNPSIRPLYKDWINTLEIEYDNIDTIRKHFDTFKTIQEHKGRAITISGVRKNK